MDYPSKISRQVAAVPRSGIRDFFDLVQGREDVISLGVGEPDYSAPWHIREAAIYSLERGNTSYTSNLGLMSLRRKLWRSGNTRRPSTMVALSMSFLPLLWSSSWSSRLRVEH